MEKVLKVFPASRWPMVQDITIFLIGLFMFWVFERSGWNVIAAVALLSSATFCWSFYRGVRRQSQEATTDKERLDANWPLMQLAMAVISVLSLCLMILKH